MTSNLERHCAPQNPQLGCRVHQTPLMDFYLERKSPPLAALKAVALQVVVLQAAALQAAVLQMVVLPVVALQQ